MIPNFEWYIPSWYGDIRLRVIDDAHTRVEVTALTKGELMAMHALKKRSLQGGLVRKQWASEKAWASMPDDAFVIGNKKPHHVILKAPIVQIEKFITRQLRGRSETVSVMITDQGNLYEIKVPEIPDEDTNVLPFRREGGQEEPAAATTVRKPAVGCPAPDFEHAHIRATDVLQRFLTPEQIADYQKHQRFVTIGGKTGKRFMLTSRHARSALGKYSRTVYGLDDERAYCVHDWGIPAAEELLTMHLMLSMPQYEGYVCGLRDDGTDTHTFQIGEARGPASGVETAPPPAHFYYDMNGCLRPFDDYEGHFVDGTGTLKYTEGNGGYEAQRLRIKGLKLEQQRLKRELKN